MKTYNHYILENNRSDTKSLTMEEFDYLLNKHCTQFNYKDTPIYRGVPLEGNFYKIDPKLYTRKSARTGNIFTKIISNSPYWNGIPPREKSLICTFNEKIARSYGDDIGLGKEKFFRVIPFNNSNWGICDTWMKMYNGENLMNFNDAVAIFYKDLFNEEIHEEDYDKLLLDLQKISIEDIKKHIREWESVPWSKILDKLLTIMLDKSITFDKVILEFLKPNEKIDKVSYSELINKQTTQLGEIWTDSICLLKGM